MIIGVLLLIGTGLAWAFTGVLLSYCAQRRIAATVLLGPQSIVGLTIIFATLPSYSQLRLGMPAGGWILAALMLAAGTINACGLLTLQHAMQRGHHGMTWAIGQSAMVLPFLLGVLVFGESPSVWRFVGLGAILISLFTFGRVRSTPVAASAQAAQPIWLPIALVALVLLGASQILSSLPSHIPALTDSARLRIPMFYLGNGAIMIVLWAQRGSRPDKRVLTLALVGAMTGVTGMLALFRGLDLLAAARLTSLGFPIAVGTCIVGFALYSAGILREPLTRTHIIGMALGVVGLALLASGA